MRERSIIMQGESVRAILAGRKTQTRRVVTHGTSTVLGERGRKKWQAFRLDLLGDVRVDGNPNGPGGLGCGQYLHVPFGDYGAVARVRCVWEPGNRLWVKEAWRECEAFPGRERTVAYAATDESPRYPQGYVAKWRSPLFMPRWASRLTLEVVEVRVHRVQELSEQDAEAEGIERDEYGRAVNPDIAGLKTRVSHTAVQAYRHAWDALNAKRGFPWASNPWVWAVTFKRVEAV